MDPEEKDADMEEKPRSEGPGRTLQAAREQAGFTIEHVARSLNLEKSVIEALEKDDISHLPGPAYVKGYLRNYARLLELDAEPLIEAYSDLAVPIPEVAPLESPTAPSVDHRVGIQVIGGLVVLVLIVLSGWWFTRPRATTHVSTPQVEATQPAKQVSKPQTQSGETANITATGSTARTQAAESSSSGGGAPASTTLSTPPAASPISPQSALPSKTPAVKTPAAIASSESPPTTASASAGAATVSLQLNEKSWVQIQDGSGKQLIRGLLGAGVHRVLSGMPPFSIFLGYAPGVVLSIDGHTVDAAQYTRSNHTARFILSADGSTHR